MEERINKLHLQRSYEGEAFLYFPHTATKRFMYLL